ncbi:hypothetical protein ACFL20_10065 [Spirochaetota bacterium]
MKKVIILLFTVMVIASLLNCSADADGDGDEYYVKYEVGSSTIYTGVKLDVIITDENDNNIAFIINAKTDWEMAIGPVQQGYNADLNVSCGIGSCSTLTIYTQISVSKNDGPFAMKVVDGSDTERDSAQINYVIDF